MNLVNAFPVSTGRVASEGLDLFVAVEIGDTLVGGKARRTTFREKVIDFAYVDTCGFTTWLLPIFGKVAGTPKLSVKIRSAVICGD